VASLPWGPLEPNIQRIPQRNVDHNAYQEGEPIMSLISVVITLIVVGVLLWLVNSYIPMDSQIKRILNIVVVVAVVVWLLNIFGLMDAIRGVRVGK
jgi:UDP-N-acetylmuramyl pentapeptide phosphotransferase/UDP-N-acetylglucosamine-1-phosphate transferase